MNSHMNFEDPYEQQDQEHNDILVNQLPEKERIKLPSQPLPPPSFPTTHFDVNLVSHNATAAVTDGFGSVRRVPNVLTAGPRPEPNRPRSGIWRKSPTCLPQTLAP